MKRFLFKSASVTLDVLWVLIKLTFSVSIALAKFFVMFAVMFVSAIVISQARR